MYDDILVPTSGEQPTATVIEHTTTVAEGANVTAHVLYVIDDQAFLTLDDEIKEDVLEDLKQEGKEAVGEAAALLEDAGVSVETEIRRGKPSDQILAYVEDEQIDLVTMGTRGDEYRNNMLGSTAQSVVSDSPVPVLTVNHAAED